MTEPLRNLNGQDLERLAALSAISRTLNASYRLDEVLARVMDVALEVLGAQRAFLMLDRGGDRPEVVAARGLDAAPEAWSTTVVRHVLETGEPVLSNEVLRDERFSGSGSLRTLGVRSVLCTPMRTRGRVRGLIWLDRTDRAASFTSTDLELLKIVADMAVTALERSLYFEKVSHSDKMAALGTLLATVAHEIRNPITAILTCGQMLEEEVRDRPRAFQLADAIVKEVDRCRDLLTRLLGLSRTRHEKPEPADPGELAREVVRLVEPEFRLEGVELRFEADADLPHLPLWQEDMTQVLLNLLGNARHAVEGRPDARVHLSVRSDPEAVRILVADNGPGLPPEHRARLFEPFFTTREGGTGLGLFVSWSIVADHGGDLRALDAPGGGAVFVVELPTPRG